MRHHISNRRSSVVRGIVLAAAVAVPSAAFAQSFVDHFNNGVVSDSDTTPGFWNTIVDQTGTAVENVGGHLTLTASGASGGDQYPFTQISSGLQNGFNFFRAPVVLQASGLGYAAGSSNVGLTEFNFTSQALSSAGPNTEYAAEDSFTLWVSNLGNPNGQVLLGIKEDAPNHSTAFDGYPLIGPIGNIAGTQTLSGQVRSFKLVLSPLFFDLTVSHDNSATDSTQVSAHYSGGLNIFRANGFPLWANAGNPQGDSALNIETQLGGTSSPTATAAFSVGQVSVTPFAQNYLGGDGGNWSSPSSWSDQDIAHPNGDGSTSSVPNFVGANVRFGPAGGPTTVISDLDETLGAIIFDSAQSYTVTVNGQGQGTLHMASRYTAAELHVVQGSHTIYSPLLFHSDALVTVDQAGSVLTAPYLTAESPTTATLTKAGPGTLAVTSVAFGTVALTGGTVQVLGNGTPTGLSVINTISSTGGSLDLTNNSMVVRSMTVADVVALAHAGELRSSLAGTTGVDALAGLGIVPNTDGEGGALFASFDGLSVGTSDVLVMYTYLGDTDLNGYVDGSDLANLFAGMHGGLTGWRNGDTNYDGVVNATDLNNLLASLRGQGAPFGNPGGGGGAGAVPEPAVTGLAVPLLGMLSRRRRMA